MNPDFTYGVVSSKLYIQTKFCPQYTPYLFYSISSAPLPCNPRLVGYSPFRQRNPYNPKFDGLEYNVDFKTKMNVLENLLWRTNIQIRMVKMKVLKTPSCPSTTRPFFSSQLPKKEELKTVVDKVKDFFGEVTSGAKESFAQITGSASDEAGAGAQEEEEKPRFKRRNKKKGKQQKSKQGFSK